LLSQPTAHRGQEPAPLGGQHRHIQARPARAETPACRLRRAPRAPTLLPARSRATATAKPPATHSALCSSWTTPARATPESAGRPTTASLLVGKLSASGHQNALAAALKEYGALRRTIYAAKYLSDPDYRRKISRQLNKGQSLHALRRDLLYAHEGMIRARHLEQQAEQAWCLTLATNAVIAWTTEYYELSVEQMRRAGQRIDDEVLAHISPAHSANSTSSARSRSTSKENWPSWARPVTGRCGSATPFSDLAQVLRATLIDIL